MSKEECGCEGNCSEGKDEMHNCECCGSENNHQRIKISLDGEEELDCAVLGVFDVNERPYIALLPDGDDEVLIFRYTVNGDEVTLGDIESDEEYEEISEVFYDIFSDEEIDFEDDDDEDEEDEEEE